MATRYTIRKGTKYLLWSGKGYTSKPAEMYSGNISQAMRMAEIVGDDDLKLVDIGTAPKTREFKPRVLGFA